jgi:hypothetical protein
LLGGEIDGDRISQPTGDPYVDGVLTGVKWGVSSLTYSFPTDPSFLRDELWQRRAVE